MSGELLTVELAAEALQLHTKTVLRFIRDGRLRATKVGKQYRILRADLDALTGTSRQPHNKAMATVVVDIDGVDEEQLRRLSATVLGAGQGRRDADPRFSVNVVHDPARRAAKVIAVALPSDAATLLTLVSAALDLG